MAYDGHDPDSVGALRGADGENLAPADRGPLDASGALSEDSFLAVASLDTAALSFLAVDRGPAGDDVSVTLVESGLDTALSVSVVGSAITVDLATDGGGAATSTATEVAAAVNGDVGASALVLASSTDDGAIVAALAVTNLSGGDVVYAGLAAFQAGWPRHG